MPLLLEVICYPCPMQSCWATFLMALVGFGLVLNKERFPKLAYGINIALLTFPIVAIPGEACARVVVK